MADWQITALLFYPHPELLFWRSVDVLALPTDYACKIISSSFMGARMFL